MQRTLALLVLAASAAGCPSDQNQPNPDLGDIGVLPLADKTKPLPIVSCAGAAPATQKFVTGTAVVTIPDASRPNRCQALRDPAFDTLVSRVTDRAADGITDEGIENEYARSDPENADGTLLVLRSLGSSWYLYDTASFKVVRKLDIGQGPQEADPRWDPNDPKVLYHVAGARLMKLNVDTNQSTLVHDFTGQVPGDQPVITTRTEGDASLDRRIWCWEVRDATTTDLNTVAVIAYDRVADSILGKLTSLKHDIDWVSASMSGNHCVVGWSGYPAEAYARNFGTSVTLPQGCNGHMDLALTSDGRDVMVYQSNSTDYIAMAHLDSGQEVNLAKIPFEVNPAIGVHVSGNSAAKPGWALVSTMGPKNLPSGAKASWMDHIIYLIELKAGPRIWRVASTRGYDAINAGDSTEYFAESYATITTGGGRIYWGSNWGSGTNLLGVETYVALLPKDWETLVP
jgi:hypothetical protein